MDQLTIFGDIHANLPALESVLAEYRHLVSAVFDGKEAYDG